MAIRSSFSSAKMPLVTDTRDHLAEAKNPTPRAQQAMGNPPHAGEDAHATNYRSGNSTQEITRPPMRPDLDTLPVRKITSWSSRSSSRFVVPIDQIGAS